MVKHFVIPDTQVRAGDNLDYLEAIGNYIVKKQPDVIVHLGDHADMPSLSSYDIGKKSFEGRRYVLDVEAAKEGMRRLWEPLSVYNTRQKKNKERQYHPRKIFCIGNHENRINRAVENDAKLDGVLSVDDLGYQEFGWETHDFLDVVIVDGIAYSHYFVTGVAGRPASTAMAQLRKTNMSSISGHQQGLQIATGSRADGVRLQSVIAGSCLTPDHKVLTADLRYVELGNIQVGDKLVSFDEEVTNKRSRRYKTGTVEAVRRANKECFTVTLESGKQFKVTGDHRWLVKTGSKYHWKTTDSIRKGTCIPRLFEEWEEETSFDAGWLSGMYDGEGSLYCRSTTGGTTMQMSISQNDGIVLDRLVDTLDWFGFPNGSLQPTGRNCYQTRLTGGTTKIAEFLGTIRPIRLLQKFKPEYLGRINSPDNNNDKVISIESIGTQEIVQIAIDAKTMIVEGYTHHNCYEHNEDYLGPQGNQHWRGVLMLHDVKDGEFDLMQIKLDWLKKKYA